MFASYAATSSTTTSTARTAASIWARKYTALGVDCAVALGTDLDDCAVGPTPYVAPDGRLIHVDLDATVFNRNVPAALGVVADVGPSARHAVVRARQASDDSGGPDSVVGRPVVPMPAVPGAARYEGGSLMNRVRQPIEQNAYTTPSCSAR